LASVDPYHEIREAAEARMAEKIEILRALRGNGENVMGKLALLQDLPRATA
jgi:hypothetical protein